MQTLLIGVKLTEKEIVYTRNPDFIFRKIVEDLILVPVYQDVAEMDAIYTLNEVGAFIWDKLGDPVSQIQLEASILDEFDTEEETVRQDTARFLQEMISIGAVRNVEA